VDLQNFILLHREDDVPTLALQLAGKEEKTFILQQVEGWQRLRHKVPSWTQVPELHYPKRLSLEQCSGEEAARYKADIATRLLPAGGTMVDLTGGFGVDFAFMAAHFEQAVYVERNAELCALARHNFPYVGASHAEVVEGDAESYLQTMGTCDLLYLDPARRDAQGRKVADLADCSPDVTALWSLMGEKARYIMLKLSPMLDISEALRLLKGITEVHVVGSGGECKELLLIAEPAKSSDNPSETSCYCHDTGQDFTFLRSEERTAEVEYVEDEKRLREGMYLYDPSAVILKAGALRLIGSRFGIKKMAPMSHLYVSESLVSGFPGRTFRILKVTGCSKRELASLRGTYANLALRNFSGTSIGKVKTSTPQALCQKWGVRDGGTLYLFATQTSSGSRILVYAEKVKE